MYTYETTPEVREQVDAMPAALLPFYAELIAFLELTPWAGPPYQETNPSGALRKTTFGPAGEGVATYVILERERRIVVVSLIWIS